MKLVETTISETAIRMRLADNADPAQAIEWIEFRAPLKPLMFDDQNRLGDPESRYLLATHQAALHRVRDAINAEIQRLTKLEDQLT